MICLGWTGSRHGTSSGQRKVVRKIFDYGPFLHVLGGCAGVDEWVHHLAWQHAHPQRIYPANNVADEYKALLHRGGGIDYRQARPAPGRNHYIIGDADVMIALPWELERPKSLKGYGTWTTIEWALERNKPTLIILGRGLVEEFGNAWQVIKSALINSSPRQRWQSVLVESD